MHAIFNQSLLRCVALAAHICWFMAGATQTGALVAKYKVTQQIIRQTIGKLGNVTTCRRN